jgi:hypothetical protein
VNLPGWWPDFQCDLYSDAKFFDKARSKTWPNSFDAFRNASHGSPSNGRRLLAEQIKHFKGCSMSILRIYLSNPPSNMEKVKSYVKRKLSDDSIKNVEIKDHGGKVELICDGGKIDKEKITPAIRYIENYKVLECTVMIVDEDHPGGAYFSDAFGTIEMFASTEEMEARKRERDSWFDFNFGKPGVHNSFLIRMKFKSNNACTEVAKIFESTLDKTENWRSDFIREFNRKIPNPVKAEEWVLTEEEDEYQCLDKLMEGIFFVRVFGQFCYVGIDLDKANCLSAKEYMKLSEYCEIDNILISLSHLYRIQRSWIKWRFASPVKGTSEVIGMYPCSDVPQYIENELITPNWKWGDI